MSATKNRGNTWKWDYAGRHGTAWGAFNVAATAVTVSWLAYLSATRWHFTSWPVAVGLVAAIGVVGVVVALLKVSLGKKTVPAATVIYKLVCWIGTAGWATWMVYHPHWTVIWWLKCVGGLAFGTVVAGVMASFGGDDPEPAPKPVEIPVPAGTGDAAERTSAAKEWIERVGRVGKITVAVAGVEQWPNNSGYTLEVVLPAGGVTIDDIRPLCAKLASDADLPPGCMITVRSGVSRRRVLIDVPTVYALADDQTYPADITKLTINEPIPIGVCPDSSEDGVNLRGANFVVVGEPESGKTNLERVLAAGFARCDDVVQWHIDLTGAGLSRPLNKAWWQGKTRRPLVDAIATNEPEAEAMLRAALRIGYARKRHYQDLMDAANDDKIPISPQVPQVMIVVDEIAAITGANCKYPRVRELLLQVMQELRASGIRVVLAGLRATDDVILNAFLALIPVRVGMRMTKVAEIAWLFEWKNGIAPEDMPYPGCAAVQHFSGDKPMPNRIYRLVPDRMEQIAVATDVWRCGLDPISEAAANGRNPDGTVMVDERGRPLDKREVDWYAHHWDGWDAGTAAAAAAEPEPGAVLPTAPPPYTGPAVNPEDAKEAFDQSLKELQDRRAQAEGVDAAFDAIVGAEEWDWTDPTSWSEPPAGADDPPTDGPGHVLDIVDSAGPGGISPKGIRIALAERGIRVSRDTVHTWLKQLAEEGKVHRARYGRWAAGPDSTQDEGDVAA